MRKGIWITGIAILALCIALVFFLQKRAGVPNPVAADQRESAASRAMENSSTNPLRESQAAIPVDNQRTSNAMRVLALPPTVSPLVKALATTNPVAAKRLALWQTPIEFYGKVVDEHTNSIAGATISFNWVEFPAEDGNRHTNIFSDAEGGFSLRSERGPNLGILVAKEGYYPRSGGARYGPAEAPEFSADPQNPVIFVLRKKGTPAELVSMKRNYRIPRDGTSVGIDLVSGANATGENGNLVVQCWTKDQGKRSGERYDWRCTVAIPGGGVVATDEEFPFLAPEIGYKPTTEINMPVGITNWNSQVDLQFYYRLADGRYGRMKFSMIAGGQHFCMIDSVLNPSGSRNLEPAN
ncbi:MAG: hypothetical protein EPO07_06570 [Verrucomicrobia bacterium]|nr:MAG: hypothetical protein EPO07_06570 [Verrucomicrobiota bacterium]